jgi:hypothetical protein
MLLFILDRSVAAPAAERPFLLYVCDRRAVDRCQIRVDDTGLRMTTHCEKAAWQHRHRAMPTTGNRWWHLPNRSPGTGSTSGLLPEGKFHRPARTCWSASSACAVVALTRGRTALPTVWSASSPRSSRSSSTSCSDREYRRYQRTAQRISAGSLSPLEDCRPPGHFTILSRCHRGPTEFATQPPLTKEISVLTRRTQEMAERDGPELPGLRGLRHLPRTGVHPAAEFCPGQIISRKCCVSAGETFSGSSRDHAELGVAARCHEQNQ